MTKPVIGITSNIDYLTRSTDVVPFEINYSPQSITDSAKIAGGIPMIIPLMDDIHAKQCINIIDALLLTGGQDISPIFYGEEPNKYIQATSPERDAYEITLIKEAIKQRKPILGICRGMQLINVVFGGTLYQDITNLDEVFVQHVQQSKPHFATHSVDIEPNSHLSNFLENEFMVNSYHHQAIKELGNNLTASAYSKDNIIEAIEYIDDNHSIIGIQWHPELTVHHDIHSVKIFEDLIKRVESFN